MRVFITGSSDGIGAATAGRLAGDGHDVVLHARNASRADDARRRVPSAAGVVVGDLASLEQTRSLADEAQRCGPFDVIVHNAGVGGGGAGRTTTSDGIETIFQVNVLAPYVLTSTMAKASRLVYLTSGLEANGVVDLEDLQHERGRWNGMQAYADSKLLDVLLAFAVARCWPKVCTNAVDPGWIRTRLGGPNATDDLAIGSATQVWLATSDEGAQVTGRYYKWQRELEANPAAYDTALQDRLLAACEELSGVRFPR